MADMPSETVPMLGSVVDTKLTNGNLGPNIVISRPAYTHNGMVSAFNLKWEEEMKADEKMKKCMMDQFACSGECLKERVLRFLPFINILRNYQWKQWLFLDLMSGISVGVIHIPQGMGFSLLTSLPPVYGLYSSLFPVFIYFFFGTSRHISMGTMALISLMIGAVVNREVDKLGLSIPQGGENDTLLGNETLAIQQQIDEVRIGTAVSVSLLIGFFQFAMGLVGLGAVATFMSMPFIGSFLTAAAVHIITSQVPSIFGLKLPGHPGMFKVPMTYYEVFYHIAETNIASLVTAILCIIVLILLKEVINERFRSRMKIPIPAELLVVILATLISHYCHLHDLFALKIVGPIPAGIPTPRLPPMNNATTYIGDALIISIISFAISISMAKLMAKKHNYAIDVNQELFAYGLCHGISSFFNCFAGAQAPPRTLVHDSIGGKTQVNSLFSCVMLLLVCLFLGKLFYSLPISVLAAIIIVALIPMFRQFQQLPTLWNVNKYDFFVWIITFSSVVILDVTSGLIIGMGTSIFFVVLQAYFSSGTSLVSINDSEVYLTKDRLLSDKIFEYPGVEVFRFNAPLFFVNVENFKSQLFEKVVSCRKIELDSSPSIIAMVAIGDESKQMPASDTVAEDSENTSHKSYLMGSQGSVVAETNKYLPNGNQTGLHAIILDCAAISYIDIMGVNMLNAIRNDLLKLNIRFTLACVPTVVAKKLEAAGSITLVDDEKTTSMFTVYPTVQDAIAIETSGIHRLP